MFWALILVLLSALSASAATPAEAAAADTAPRPAPRATMGQQFSAPYGFGDAPSGFAPAYMRYMKQYAIPYGEKNADPSLVPRAMYAVYNAGPRAVGRFNKEKRHPREARVDDRLFSLYKGIASGAQPDLASCGIAQ